MISKTDPEWPGSFEATEREHLRAAQRTTSEERLRWLEQMIVFAYKAGAIRPQRRITREEWEEGKNLEREEG